MISPFLEKIFFHNIIGKQQYVTVCDARFFDDPTLRKLFPEAKEFFVKYQEMPSAEQMQEIVKMHDTGLTPTQVEAVWSIEMGKYEEAWLEEHTETFIEYKNLDLSVVDVNTYLKTTMVDSSNIKEVVMKIKQIITERNSLDFGFSEGSDFFLPRNHRQKAYNTFPSGYKFIDEASGGGFSAKTLTVFLGPPKVGKSAWLGNLAAESIRAGHNTAVVTLEMDEQKYIKRIGANLLNVPIGDYKRAAEDEDLIKKKLSNLNFENPTALPGKMFVKQFATSTASAIDVESWLRRTEEREKIKFKVVVIDYLNIMKNWRNPNTENTYMKIKQIAEDVRAMAINNEWAVVSATQTKQCLTLDTKLISKNRGEIELRKLKINEEILCHLGWTRVLNKTKPVKQKIYKIITKSGKCIKASKKHIFPLSDGRELTVSDLKTGDKLLVKSV